MQLNGHQIKKEKKTIKKLFIGTSATTFEPDRNCAIKEFLTMLWRSSGAKRHDKNGNPYQDYYPDITDDIYYKGALNWVKNENIFVNDLDKNIDSYINKRDAITILYNMNNCKCYLDTKVDDIELEGHCEELSTDTWY